MRTCMPNLGAELSGEHTSSMGVAKHAFSPLMVEIAERTSCKENLERKQNVRAKLYSSVQQKMSQVYQILDISRHDLVHRCI